MPTESTPLLASPGIIPTTHYLWLPRFIVLQVVSLLSGVDSLAGLYTLRLLNAKTALATAHGAALDFSNFWWMSWVLNAAGGIAGAICGLVFIIMMLRPTLKEWRVSVIAKESVFSFVTVILLVAVVFSTIVVATQSATLLTPDLSHKERAELLEQVGSLAYRNFPTAIAFVVMAWVVWLFLVLSLVLVSVTGRHVLAYGPAIGVKQTLPERLANKHLAPLFGKHWTVDPIAEEQ